MVIFVWRRQSLPINRTWWNNLSSFCKAGNIEVYLISALAYQQRQWFDLYWGIRCQEHLSCMLSQLSISHHCFFFLMETQIYHAYWTWWLMLCMAEKYFELVLDFFIRAQVLHLISQIRCEKRGVKAPNYIESHKLSYWEYCWFYLHAEIIRNQRWWCMDNINWNHIFH